MKFDVTKRQAMELALQDQEKALEFFESPEGRAYKMPEEFLNARREEIKDAKRKLEDGDFDAV